MTGDDGERSSRRARWVLALAVVSSVLLVGGVVLVGRSGRHEAAPAIDLPGPWEPPTVAGSPTLVLIPAASAGTTSPSPAKQEVSHRARTTAPDPAGPTVSPVTPILTVSRDSVPATVDLAAEGGRDWVHWGLASATSLDRKAGGTGEIRDLGGVGGRGRYDNNPSLFGWTGGTPTASAGPSPTGVYVCGQGGGFTVSVAASPSVRTLRLYAGVWMARGKLTLSLAGRTVTADLENPQTISTARFVIRFRAPAGQALQVTWRTDAVYHPDCGNVDVQAATLS